MTRRCPPPDTPRRPVSPTALAVLVTAVLLGACGSGADVGATSPVSPARTGPDDSSPHLASARPAPEVRGEVLVSAAASLTDAFAAIEDAFERTHPAVDVVLNLAGSSSLREQLLEGAPADVFASADTTNMDRVVDAGLTDGRPRVFTTNLLRIAVPPGNPGGVTSLQDFADEDLLIGLCAAQVPCGDLARQALANTGVTAAVDTNEPDVRALLTKIEAGELDAGITYVTDVVATDGGVQGIAVPEDRDVVAHYPIAALADAPNPAAADAFVTFVRDGRGQQVLRELGFQSP